MAAAWTARGICVGNGDDRIPFGDSLGPTLVFAVASGAVSASWSLVMGLTTRVHGITWRPFTVGLVTGIAFAAVAMVLVLGTQPLRHWRLIFGVMRGVVLPSNEAAGTLGALTAVRLFGTVRRM